MAKKPKTETVTIPNEGNPASMRRKAETLESVGWTVVSREATQIVLEKEVEVSKSSKSSTESTTESGK